MINIFCLVRLDGKKIPRLFLKNVIETNCNSLIHSTLMQIKNVIQLKLLIIFLWPYHLTRSMYTNTGFLTDFDGYKANLSSYHISKNTVISPIVSW